MLYVSAAHLSFYCSNFLIFQSGWTSRLMLYCVRQNVYYLIAFLRLLLWEVLATWPKLWTFLNWWNLCSAVVIHLSKSWQKIFHLPLTYPGNKEYCAAEINYRAILPSRKKYCSSVTTASQLAIMKYFKLSVFSFVTFDGFILEKAWMPFCQYLIFFVGGWFHSLIWVILTLPLRWLRWHSTHFLKPQLSQSAKFQGTEIRAHIWKVLFQLLDMKAPWKYI